jgi:hypothetical protein
MNVPVSNGRRFVRLVAQDAALKAFRRPTAGKPPPDL